MKGKNLKRIVVNLTGLANKAKGMTRYAYNLFMSCEQMGEYKNIPVSYIFGKGNYPKWNYVMGQNNHYVTNIYTLDKGRLASLARYLVPLPGIKNDVCIFNPYYQSCIFYKNQIITIHDLIPLKFPRQNKFQYLAFKILLPILLKKCLTIVAVSQTTKDAIVSAFGINESKIRVIYNTVQDNKFIRLGEHKENNLLLVVGAHLPHKNIIELINYHNLWSSKYKLEIIAGESFYVSQLRNLVYTLGIEDRVKFLNEISDEQLVKKYQQSRALIFPSLDEGFGLPLIEAMSCGTPVIASNIPVHKEICGDAAIYITPGQRESWEKSFSLMERDDLLEIYINRGLQRARFFSWENSAKRLIELFKSTLSH